MRISLLFHCFSTLNLLILCNGATRLYYLCIKEIEWNYAPTGRNVISDTNITLDQDASVFLQQGRDRIGSIYKKAVYKQYSDGTYTREIQQPAWLGYLGPVIKGEVGDVLIIHLKNDASRPYTVHPHGVFYKKDSEGSLYPDNTHGDDKKDDAVPPGGHHTYVWNVTEDHAPTSDDPSCLTWIYHSHVDAPCDIATGLIGALLTCKRGVLDGTSLTRTDVDRDFILMFSVVDENMSWYLDDNIKHYAESDSVIKDDEEFQESNKMHAINGYLFGNLPGIEMCSGDHVSWHLFGIGNEVDIHTAFFHGQTLTIRNHRSDVVSLFPATFVTAEMLPSHIGKWLLSCQVNDHLKAGMLALYKVNECYKSSNNYQLNGKKREYFIAAEDILWNYGPSGTDNDSGKSLTEPDSYSEIFFKKGPKTIGGEYWKVKYVEYTDSSFQTVKKQNASEHHLGILGPVIKAEVGDNITVVFFNNASRPYSVQPHGVLHEKGSEGTIYNDGEVWHGSAVNPSEKKTYSWMVPQHVGPTASDPPCLIRMYYSGVDPIRDTHSGLVGPLVICRPGSLNEDNRQIGVDKEFYLLFIIFDENLSWKLNDSMLNVWGELKSTLLEESEFLDSNNMYSVNGFVFSNLPGLEMCKGENVSWHLLGLGSEHDVHAVVFEGNTIMLDGKRRDSAVIFPHTFVTATMQPDNTGTFGVICQSNHHFLGGMKQHYQVFECDNKPRMYGESFKVVRVYYLMAVELEWDYSPDRTWELARHNRAGNESYGDTFVGKEDNLIGSKYKKVVYKEYTDETFKTRKERSEDEEHLGILGPLISAEVGDIIIIVFKNNATHPYSVHAHGVQELNLGQRSAAMPGEIVTYEWLIQQRSGPGQGDSHCITWAYYSTVHLVKDLHSGLIGPLVVCQKGLLNPKGRRKDIDREFALLFLVFDENESWYLEDNIRVYLNKELPEMDLENSAFVQSNRMHAINGMVYANLHGLSMYQGDRVDWYLLGMGTDTDIHTVHFHAESFTYMSTTRHRADVFDLFPATFQTVEMVVTNPGTWLLHCHVSDHIHAGMEITYTVIQKRDKAIPATVKTRESDSNNKVILFGQSVAHVKAELMLTALSVAGIVLLVVVFFLTGVTCYLSKKKGTYENHITRLPLNIL
ncbi:hephaestin [Protopterus annectens]|uniref:hephaestin n=1 Tax=Protopterus annectens TaxID=7888 RepID=UPI001CFB36A6|nr:hephaestin [Protopterus annectens]XP_043913131.1 hephaestin [Protopterus annectens]